MKAKFWVVRSENYITGPFADAGAAWEYYRSTVAHSDKEVMKTSKEYDNVDFSAVRTFRVSPNAAPARIIKAFLPK